MSQLTRAESKAKAQKRRNRFAAVVAVLGVLFVSFSYYFYQVFYTPNIETKGKPTYVIVRRGDELTRP